MIFSTSVHMFSLQWRNPECCVCLQCWNAEYRITVHRSPSSTFWSVCPILYVVYLTAFRGDVTAFRGDVWGGGMYRNHCEKISFRIIKLQYYQIVVFAQGFSEGTSTGHLTYIALTELVTREPPVFSYIVGGSV